MKICDKPCAECPFRRKACPGWLGLNEPRHFVQLACAGQSIGCHKTIPEKFQNGIDYEHADAIAPRCAGALQLMRNEGIVPNDMFLARVVMKMKADPKVFGSRDGFIQYHEKAPVRSWEMRR